MLLGLIFATNTAVAFCLETVGIKLSAILPVFAIPVATVSCRIYSLINCVLSVKSHHFKTIFAVIFPHVWILTRTAHLRGGEVGLAVVKIPPSTLTLFVVIPGAIIASSIYIVDIVVTGGNSRCILSNDTANQG